MIKPEICGVITDHKFKPDTETEALVDLYEVRVDLIGDGWQEVSLRLRKPWIVSARDMDQGGNWQGNTTQKTDIFLEAVKLGASIVDIDLSTPGLEDTIALLKPGVKCLVSSHNFKLTPSLDELRQIVKQQLAIHADLCKIVTTARKSEDNIILLQLISDFPWANIIAFAMGELGMLSRVLSPLVGGSFTYASLEKGRESAPGQLTAKTLREIYGAMQ